MDAFWASVEEEEARGKFAYSVTVGPPDHKIVALGCVFGLDFTAPRAPFASSLEPRVIPEDFDRSLYLALSTQGTAIALSCLRACGRLSSMHYYHLVALVFSFQLPAPLRLSPGCLLSDAISCVLLHRCQIGVRNGDRCACDFGHTWLPKDRALSGCKQSSY